MPCSVTRVTSAIAAAITSCAAASFQFNPPTLVLTGEYPVAVAIGDVTGDGRADLVAMNSTFRTYATSSHVLIFEQLAGGTLAAPVAVRYGSTYENFIGSIELVDLDGDQLLDIVAAGRSQLTVIRRSAVGAYTAQIIPTTHWHYALGSTDFNRDGRADLVSLDISRYVHTYLGDGLGGVHGHVVLPSNMRGNDDLAFADINSDGFDDLVIGTGGSSYGARLYIRPHNGVDGFAAEQWGALPEPYDQTTRGVAVADFTGDLRNDIVVGGSCLPPAPAGLWLFAQTAAHTLATATPVAGVCAKMLETADVDLDGDADVVLAGPNLVLYSGGPQGLAHAQTLALPAAPAVGVERESLALGDINGDACIDAVVADVNRGLLVSHGQGCEPAFDLAVQMQPAAGQPDALQIDVQHLAGVAATGARLIIEVWTEAVGASQGAIGVEPTVESQLFELRGCKTMHGDSQSQTMRCNIDEDLQVGQSYSVAINLAHLRTWSARATVEADALDYQPQNNQRSLQSGP